MKTNLIVTKYFDPKHIKDIKAGRFRFGTLKQYSGYEDKSGRLSDKGEGTASLGLYPKSGRAKFTDHRGNQFDISYVGDGVPIEYSMQFNEYIFCASIGPYDESHHQKMLYGAQNPDGTHYAGNPTLTGFAEIDVDRFVGSIFMQAIHDADWMAKVENVHECFVHAKVSYGERIVKTDVERDFHLDFSEIDGGHYLRSLLVKPTQFEIENEYRLVARWCAPKFLPLGAKEKFFQSEGLAKSIMNLGILEQT